MSGDLLDVDFQYYNKDYVGLEGLSPDKLRKGHAVFALNEENGEQYLSLKHLDVSTTVPEIVTHVQQQLTAAGYDCGAADGIAGEQTINAANAYRRDHGMRETDYISTGLVNALDGVGSLQSGTTINVQEETTMEDIW